MGHPGNATPWEMLRWRYSTQFPHTPGHRSGYARSLCLFEIRTLWNRTVKRVWHNFLPFSRFSRVSSAIRGASNRLGRPLLVSSVGVIPFSSHSYKHRPRFTECAEVTRQPSLTHYLTAYHTRVQPRIAYWAQGSWSSTSSFRSH